MGKKIVCEFVSLRKRLIEEPEKDDKTQVRVKMFLKIRQRVFHVVLHRIDGDIQFFRYLTVFLVLESAHNKYPPALLRKCVDMKADTFLQFLPYQHSHRMPVVNEDRIEELAVFLVCDGRECQLRTMS